jgi:hypothetical protein
MFSFGSIVFEDGEDGAEGQERSVTIRAAAYPKESLFWWLCLLYQVGVYATLGLHIHLVGWETWRVPPPPHGGEGLPWFLVCGIFPAAFVARAARGYAKERSSQLSLDHPRLHRVLTIRWPETSYRAGAKVSPTVELDGRVLLAGELLGVATDRGGYTLHLVFRDAAVELLALGATNVLAAQAFACEIASRLQCMVATETRFKIDFLREDRLLSLPGMASVLSATMGSLFTVAHRPAGLGLLLASLCLNIGIASWGGRLLVKARSREHALFMETLMLAPPNGEAGGANGESAERQTLNGG